MTSPSPLTDWRQRVIIPEVDLSVAPPISLAITGDWGCGKTQCALSFPNSFWIYSDANVGKINSAGVPYVSVSGKGGYQMFDRDILPAIDKRDKFFEPYSTIVLDSFSFMQADLGDNIPELDDPKETRGAYRTLKKDSNDVLRKFTKLAIAPRPGAQTWNVVVTCHLGPTFKKQKGSGRGQELELDKYAPLIEGGARNMFGGYFNTVLLLRTEKEAGGPTPTDKWYAYSRAPSVEYLCKDSVGGPPGPWAKLPPKLDVTDKSLYQVLTDAWGFPKETPK